QGRPAGRSPATLWVFIGAPGTPLAPQAPKGARGAPGGGPLRGAPRGALGEAQKKREKKEGGGGEKAEGKLKENLRKKRIKKFFRLRRAHWRPQSLSLTGERASRSVIRQ